MARARGSYRGYRRKSHETHSASALSEGSQRGLSACCSSGSVPSTAMALAALQVDAKSGLVSQQTDQKAENPWQRWLNEDVVYIISGEEEAAFEGLKTDEERQHLVEQFWARRDPTPGTPQNEFKEEHYRRIEYANKHWSGNLLGWKTDRSRIYISYGPPDEIDSHRHRVNIE